MAIGSFYPISFLVRAHTRSVIVTAKAQVYQSHVLYPVNRTSGQSSASSSTARDSKGRKRFHTTEPSEVKESLSTFFNNGQLEPVDPHKFQNKSVSLDTAG
jgi:hypothetical protein